MRIDSDADLDEALPRLCNWGRWGPDDQVGTLNLITPEHRRRAAALVRSGRAVPVAAVAPHGATRLGMEHLAAHGICGRGVLLDTAADGTREPGTAVRVADLEAAEQAQDVRVEEGDLLLVRTGWRGTRERRSGLHPECLPWLHDRGVALLGGDGDSDVEPAPPGFQRWASAMHAAALPFLGLPLLDGAELEVLAAACREEQRWAFLLIVTPWRLAGTTSAPVTPLAVL